jgi:hypothetical protein
MSFLTPLFLLGLAGIAVPVIIHLIQKERKNVVAFPSLMFLRRIPYQSVNRRRIRNWPLLLLRLAALALIVLAFARPFLNRESLAAAAAGGAREVVILLDRSYSVGYGDRWQRAVATARDAIRGLNPGDRATLALFDTGAEVALRSTSDKGRLEAALAGAEVSAAATKFGPALKLAGSILSESGLPNREVVLISDFQRLGWLGAEGVRLPDGTKVAAISVAEPVTPNVAITPAVLQRAVASGQERITITAGALNRGPAAVDVPISLEVDGRVIETRPLKLEPNGSASATFSAFAPTTRFTRGTVRLGDDRLARDNVFHFVVSPSQRVKLVLVERPGASRAASLYLAQALALSEAPAFDVVQRPGGGVTPDDLKGAAVIVLNDVAVSQSFAEQLSKFVEGGGGLFAAYGERATWPTELATVVPALPMGTVDRTRGTPGRIGSVEYGSPVFESFRGPRSGDFSAARFYNYRAVTPAAEGSRVLARYDDGAPALLERRFGNGRSLVWTSTLDVAWNDMALKPVFLPFIHRLGATLASYTQRPPFMTVGEVTSAAPAPGPGGTPARMQGAAPVVLTPAGKRLSPEGTAAAVELTEQGFYEIRAGEKDAEPLTLAANVDLAESDLTSIDPQDVVAGATGLAGGAAAAGSNGTVTNEERERTQRVWWYLLFAGLVLLTGETILANGIRTRYL